MARHPNILIISTHDTGRHFGCYGVSSVHTPTIDGLAAEGVHCERMFATSSICSPSRVSTLTGLYPQRHGVVGLAGNIWQWRMREPTRHLASVLRRSGYRSLLFGLQHEATADEVAGLGFEQWRTPFPQDSYAGPDARTIARDVAVFLKAEASGNGPFYAQVGFFETHTPYSFGGAEADWSGGVFVPPFARDDDETRAHLAHLQGALRQADAAVGIVMSALREAGLERETIVVFCTDHGIELPGGVNYARAKWSCYDAGLAAATIIRWPGGGVTGGRTCELLLSNIDVVPTLCELAGVELATDLDGRSFAAALTGQSQAPLRDVVHGLFAGEPKYAARSEDFKIIRNFGERGTEQAKRKPQPTVELYDLRHDPLETRNVASDAEYAEAYGQMSGRLWSWLEEMDDPILKGPLPTPTYLKAIAEYRARRQGAR